jgi:hypothetical protein
MECKFLNNISGACVQEELNCTNANANHAMVSCLHYSQASSIKKVGHSKWNATIMRETYDCSKI